MLAVSNNTNSPAFGHNVRIYRKYQGQFLTKSGKVVNGYICEARRGKKVLCNTNYEGKIIVSEKSQIGADSHIATYDAKDYYNNPLEKLSLSYLKRRHRVLKEKKEWNEFWKNAYITAKRLRETGEFP